MSNKGMTHAIENDRVLVLERTFEAPRALVFRMYKDPDHLKHWWGPLGWELPVCKIDFRPGGKWHYCMKCVDKSQGPYYGMESWGMMVYKEIVEPEKLVYTDYFSDASGEINKDLPGSDTVATFIDVGGKTKLVSRTEYATPEAMKTVLEMGMLEGIGQTWDRLAERLQKSK